MSDNMTLPLEQGNNALSLHGGVKALQAQRSVEQDKVSEAGRTLAKARSTKADEPVPEEEEAVEEETVEAVEEETVEAQEQEQETPEETTIEESPEEEVAEEEVIEEANGVLLTLDDGTPLTADDIKKGYLREADYTRKTQKLASERKAVESEAKARITALDAALASMKPEPEPNWEQLAESNPNDGQIYKLRYEKRSQERQNAVAILRQEQTNIIEKSKQNADNDLQSGVYRSDWKKADVFENDLSKTSQFALEKLGFGADEIHNIADPRAIMALDMARRFAETSKKVQTANKKVARKPKVLKGGAKTSLKAGKNRVVASAQEAFDKNPSRANAMALMKAKRSSKT